jgi:hypothetical protein
LATLGLAVRDRPGTFGAETEATLKTIAVLRANYDKSGQCSAAATDPTPTADIAHVSGTAKLAAAFDREREWFQDAFTAAGDDFKRSRICNIWVFRDFVDAADGITTSAGHSIFIDSNIAVISNHAQRRRTERNDAIIEARVRLAALDHSPDLSGLEYFRRSKGGISTFRGLTLTDNDLRQLREQSDTAIAGIIQVLAKHGNFENSPGPGAFARMQAALQRFQMESRMPLMTAGPRKRYARHSRLGRTKALRPRHTRRCSTGLPPRRIKPHSRSCSRNTARLRVPEKRSSNAAR